jgi:hypothetical protein
VYKFPIRDCAASSNNCGRPWGVKKAIGLTFFGLKGKNEAKQPLQTSYIYVLAFMEARPRSTSFHLHNYFAGWCTTGKQIIMHFLGLCTVVWVKLEEKQLFKKLSIFSDPSKVSRPVLGYDHVVLLLVL